MPGPTVLSLGVSLLILSVGFWLFERLRPADRRTRRTTADTRVDVIYWFFTPLVTRAVTRIALGVAFALIAWQQGVTFERMRELISTRQTWASSLPLWIQAPLILLMADLLAYGSHRLFHARWLWPFHAVHHSSTAVDWLSSVRLHPVNDVVSRLVQVLPLYWMGFSGAALAAFVPLLTFYALVLHANLNWSYGPLRFVIASPVFHRWHHTSEVEGLNRNFAGFFPFIDLAFGTFYMPRGREPQIFGVAGDPVPAGLWQQLMYPFRRGVTTGRTLGVVLACASGLLVSAQQTVPSQTPVASPGGSKPVAAIAGVWDYNKNLSVDAATGKPEQTPQSATQRRRGGASASSGGGGGTTGATSGGGSSLDWERRMEAMFIAERRALVGDLMEVPEILTIRVTNDGVTFVDDLKRERTYPTDGKLRKYQIGAAQFDARASWDGAQFRKDIEGSNGFRMSEVYFLSEDGNRLIVVLRIGDPKKIEAQFGVNRVYDRVTTG